MNLNLCRDSDVIQDLNADSRGLNEEQSDLLNAMEMIIRTITIHTFDSDNMLLGLSNHRKRNIN